MKKTEEKAEQNGKTKMTMADAVNLNSALDKISVEKLDFDLMVELADLKLNLKEVGERYGELLKTVSAKYKNSEGKILAKNADPLSEDIAAIDKREVEVDCPELKLADLKKEAGAIPFDLVVQLKNVNIAI